MRQVFFSDSTRPIISRMILNLRSRNLLDFLSGRTISIVVFSWSNLILPNAESKVGLNCENGSGYSFSTRDVDRHVICGCIKTYPNMSFEGPIFRWQERHGNVLSARTFSGLELHQSNEPRFCKALQSQNQWPLDVVIGNNADQNTKRKQNNKYSACP